MYIYITHIAYACFNNKQTIRRFMDAFIYYCVIIKQEYICVISIVIL